MRLSVFGLGYVGAVSAGCLARNGHQVIGVDAQQGKVDTINAGRSPIVERGLGETIAQEVAAGRLRATTSARQAIEETDLSLVCVGTPSQPNGNLDLTYVRRVCQDIGVALRTKRTPHLIVVRSTMLPGSMRALVRPTLEAASGKQAGEDFYVCNNPEFLREGTALEDFYNPPKTVIGEWAPGEADALAALYADLDAPMVRTDVETAEMVKYTDNAWHALKVAFGNEIGNIAKAVGLDGHKVMDIFCQDRKLNISTTYLKPGFAFGGSCLPKDLRALTYKGRQLDLELPLLNAILSSNQCQFERGVQMVLHAGKKRIGILGMAFKPGTDDLRESPQVTLIETLIGKGYDVRIYDRNINLSGLMGTNKDYARSHIPHICKLMVRNIGEVVEFAETIVIGNASEDFRNVLPMLQPHQVVVDLARISSERSEAGRYDGICW